MKTARTILLFSLVICLSVVRPSAAHQPDLSEEMLSYIKRDGLMHLINAQRYILIEMLVGKRDVDQAEFVRASKALVTLFSMIPSTFEKNHMVYSSRAKPEIWENWEDFIAKAKDMQRIAEELVTMAETQGADESLEKVRQLSCGGCHDVYRN